jgi:carboxymethylenebutenolidase
MRDLKITLLCVLITGAAVAPFALASGRRAASGVADTARVHVGPADEGSDAFVAWPAGSAPAPALVILHEWWGLNGQIRDLAQEFARRGYVAVVPDLYHGQVASDPDRARALAQRLDPADANRVIGDAVDWLRSQPRTARSHVGLVGFCMGGGLAERFALQASGLGAVVMFYGQPETDRQKLAGLRAPLQGHFGQDDSSISLAKVNELRSALAAAGKTAEIFVYPGAGHAFMHDGSDAYRPAAARQAWARMLDFLQEQLKTQ